MVRFRVKHRVRASVRVKIHINIRIITRSTSAFVHLHFTRGCCLTSVTLF